MRLLRIGNTINYRDSIGQEIGYVDIAIYRSAHYNMGNYKEAMECYDRAIEINPNDAAAWYNKGNALGILENYKERWNAMIES